MNFHHQLVVTVVAAAVMLASAGTPLPIFDHSAIAQSTDGRGPANKGNGPNRAGPPGKVDAPLRATPPKLSRAPERSSPERTIRREGVGPPNRLVSRDGDRRRGNGWRGDGDGRRGDGERRRGTRHVWGPGFTFYFYDGFYHGDCSWLRRKARETGSSYWRQRYAQCRDA